MANISGTGTVWNLPNYAGQIYSSTPAQTPFLNLIAAKAVKTDNFLFPTGVEYAHNSAAQPAISENQSLTAPAAVGYVRTQGTNVTQIFQEKVSVSYARLANSGRFSGAYDSLSAAQTPGELEFQTARALEKIARDIEYTFVNGKYQLSTGATVANKTRGILAACGTSVDAENSPLTRAMLNGALATAYAAGADISCCRPVEQDVPGKGSFFREALSRTGAAEEYQIFGQLGLDHGPMWKHFKITGIGAGESRTPVLVSDVTAG